MNIMKNKYISLLLILPFLFLYSCYDDKMEWVEVDKDSQISEGEIPLQMAEKIARYEALKNYASFNLGIGVDLATYLDNDVYASIVNENFHEVVIGYDMKHGPMVKSDGTINFDRVDAFIAKAKQNGLGVYGHTLVWHQNQNARYLNGLIADRVIIDDSGDVDIANIVTNGEFESGDIDPWYGWGNGTQEISAEGEGYESDYAMLLTNNTSGDSWSSQTAYDFATPLTVGVIYKFSAMVKGSVANDDFTLQVLNSSSYSGEGYISGATIPGEWVLIEGEFECSMEDLDRLCINFGKVEGTYLVDNFMFGEKIENKDPMINIITNSTFESGDIEPWDGWGNNSTREISAEGEGYNSDYSMVLVNPADADSWSAQTAYTFATDLEVGKVYMYSAMVKSDVVNDDFTFQVQNSSSYDGEGYVSGTTVPNEWTIIEGEFTCSLDAMDRLCINFGKVEGTYYVDNFKFGEKIEVEEPEPAPVLKSVTFEPKSDEEKEQIIGDAMEFFITEMMKHYKDDVDAWDVVNEPMKENGQLRDGEVAELESDEFYWVKYLGKDYAVKAFKTARENAKPGDKLFINDYNLEHSIPKCEGIIDYVNYIESQGATVDGIGTQMHIGIETNKDNIREMFELLAASGKLIKVTELDIRVNTDAPSADHFEQQAEMYQYVVDTYTEVIPEAQQYGITVWGVSDHADEHEYWIPDDAPNIWDAKYQRKLSYKTFADGLAGKDISDDFTGELIIDEDDSSEEENEEEE